MRVLIDDEHIVVRLALWQKALGLTRDIRVARADVSEVRVVEDPVREAMEASMKFGLRLPWLYYVARTIRLDQFFVVRRGVPGLSFAVSNGTPLRRVLLSTPDAHELAARLERPARPSGGDQP